MNEAGEPGNNARQDVGTYVHTYISQIMPQGQDVFAAVFVQFSWKKSTKMAEPTYFLVRWSVDGSLSVSTANAIQLGEKVVGGEVTALYQRKLYNATIVAHGKFYIIGFNCRSDLKTCQASLK